MKRGRNIFNNCQDYSEGLIRASGLRDDLLATLRTPVLAHLLHASLHFEHRVCLVRSQPPASTSSPITGMPLIEGKQEVVLTPIVPGCVLKSFELGHLEGDHLVGRGKIVARALEGAPNPGCCMNGLIFEF